MAEDLGWLFGPDDDEFNGSAATPVTVLTGFLGAGKTTLVNRILAEDHGLRIAVLVNDFGAVDVDSELVVGVKSGQVSMANGCVCCEVRDDLVRAIDSCIRDNSEIDAIVLEASGVAEPMTIARTLVSPGYEGRIRLDGIIAVVDAEQAPDLAEDPVTRDLVFGQIGYSDIVLLNKIDLADRDRVNEVRKFVHDRLPSVRIIETTRVDVPFGVLVGASPSDTPGRVLVDHHDHDHDGFASWVYRRDGEFDLNELQACLSRLPRSVYRVKGFVHGEADPGHRMLAQAVGRRAEIVEFDEWGDAPASTTLVVIGSAAEMDRESIVLALDSCMATSAMPD